MGTGENRRNRLAKLDFLQRELRGTYQASPPLIIEEPAMPVPVALRAILQQQEPGAAIAGALDRLLELDEYLLRVDANERSLTHRFAMHLQEQLRDWHVDCEYNRNGVDPKRLILHELQPGADDTDGQTVFPDVIAHMRDTPLNYVVIEFKKTSSRVPDRVDLHKLHAYKHDARLRYLYALFVVLQVGPQPGVARVAWVD